MRILILFSFLILCSPAHTKPSGITSKIAIIIDDIGYRKSDIDAVTIPGQLTFAILPHTPHGKKLAERAYADEKEVILHMPMEATNGGKLGPGALTSEMSENAFRDELNRAFDEIPFAIGINNHMGSQLTQLYQPMAWTMRFLKERNLIFIDSLTTQKSKAKKVANHFGVPTRQRHVFLDNEQEVEYIGKQFAQLIKDAKRFKSVVAIAHPHPETVIALTQLIPTLKQHNIELVPISALLPKQHSRLTYAKTNIHTGVNDRYKKREENIPTD